MIMNWKTGAVCAFLCTLIKQFGKQQENGWLIDFPITNEDIAGCCGISTRNSVNRILHRLKEDGIIDLHGQRILCWICSICNNMFKNSRTLRLGGTAPRQVDSAQTKKRPQFRRTGGAMFRYKDLPECQSICGLCAYCSSCTYTLLRPRRSRLGLRTSGNSLVPAILDGSLYCCQDY